MLTFLQMVAAAFVAFVLLLAVAYVVIRWKLKKWLKTFGDQLRQIAAAGVPPFRVDLEPDDDLDWDDETGVFEKTAELEAAGFSRVGDYDAGALLTRLRAFVAADGYAYAVLYEHEIAGVFVDLVAIAADGERGWTYCSRADDGSTKPPWQTTRYRPEVTLADLVAEFRDEVAGEALRPLPGDEFKSIFEAAYAREMDWRIERGGPDEAEVRRVCEASGEEFSEAGLAAVRTQWAEAIRNHYDAEFRERFLKIEPPPISLAEAEAADERVVFVHDRLGALGLAAAYDLEFFDPAGDGPDFDEDDDLDEDDEDEPQVIEERAVRDRCERLKLRCEELLAETSPRRAFSKLVAGFDPDREYRHLAVVEEPFPADAYWRPGWREED